MAQRTVIQLVDDLTGEEITSGSGGSTVRFGVDGASYELDLSAQNAAALREALDPYVTASRRVGGSRSRGTARRTSTGVDNKAVRAWARSNGVTLNARGRIPAEVLEQYRSAGN